MLEDKHSVLEIDLFGTALLYLRMETWCCNLLPSDNNGTFTPLRMKVGSIGVDL